MDRAWPVSHRRSSAPRRPRPTRGRAVDASGTADIIRRVLIRMPDALEAAGLSWVRMLLQVHDERVFETPEADAEAAMTVIRQVMETADEPAVKLSVPLVVDARAATNWDEAH